MLLLPLSPWTLSSVLLHFSKSPSLVTLPTVFIDVQHLCVLVAQFLVGGWKRIIPAICICTYSLCMFSLSFSFSLLLYLASTHPSPKSHNQNTMKAPISACKLILQYTHTHSHTVLSEQREGNKGAGQVFKEERMSTVTLTSDVGIDESHQTFALKEKSKRKQEEKKVFLTLL